MNLKNIIMAIFRGLIHSNYDFNYWKALITFNFRIIMNMYDLVVGNPHLH